MKRPPGQFHCVVEVGLCLCTNNLCTKELLLALSDVKQANLPGGMGSSGAAAAFAQDGVEVRTLPSPVLFEQAR